MAKKRRASQAQADLRALEVINVLRDAPGDLLVLLARQIVKQLKTEDLERLMAAYRDDLSALRMLLALSIFGVADESCTAGATLLPPASEKLPPPNRALEIQALDEIIALVQMLRAAALKLQEPEQVSGVDETEPFRRERLTELNSEPHDNRAAMEAKYGQVWTTAELQRDFTVLGFMAPFCVVQRKSDGKKGSVEFVHSPRWYFNWQEDKG